MTSNQLLLQYDTFCDIIYDNERYLHECGGGGHSEEVYADIVRDTNDMKNLLAEIKLRKSNNTLYDGKRDIIVRVWAWATQRISDNKHLYNAVRSIMSKKYDVYMVKYSNRIDGE